MKLKLATIVNCTKTLVTIFFVLETKDKKEIKRTLKVPKKAKEPIDELFDDFWHSIWVGKTCYDVNLWHEDRGRLKASLYKTNKVEGSEFLETDTSSFTSCVLKSIPLEEYKIDRKGVIKKQF